MPDFYFGKEESAKYSEEIQKRYANQTISKRRDKAESKGGLLFEASALGIKWNELIRALEGMCYEGKAREIDDSTYFILPITN